MAKASKTFVDWLRKGERGWVDLDGFQYKWDGSLLHRLRPQDDDWLVVGGSCDSITENRNFTEVYPRPAPRRKVRTRTIRVWAIVDEHGYINAKIADKREAKAMARGADTIVKLTGEYTPKKARRK